MSGKLRTRIFQSIFCLLVIYIVISVGVTMGIFYGNMEKRAKQNNQTIALYMKQYLDLYGETQIEDLVVPNDERITLISKEGVVLYDSKTSHERMENHMARPEIQQALQTGSGSAKRMSDTLEEKYYYHALQLENGDMLRVATAYDSIFAAFAKIIPFLLLIAVAVVLVSWWISHYHTQKIIAPINAIDILEPEACEVYEELTPFVARIRKQNKVIGEQMENLKAKQMEFMAITENMQEGLIVLGKNGRVLSYNNSAMHLLDIHDAGLLVYGNVIRLNRNTGLTKLVQQALEGKRAETKMMVKSKICQLIANPVMDEEICTGVVVLIMDVTEREMSETMRREFSANVSHELKTPLTAISGYAEIIKSGIAREEDIQKFAEIIYTESARMIKLVGDIMRISKLDERNISLEKTSFDLGNLLDEIVQRVSYSAQQKKVELIFEERALEAQLCSVRQVVDDMLYNVVENAVKYNKNGGKVWISLHNVEGKLSVCVKDTGIGIPSQDIDRVFERFYRVDKSHSREIGGTGLGLSIVKHGAAFTGTTVKLESVEGEGTNVRLEFA